METSALLDQAFRDTAFSLVSSFNMDWHVATPDTVKAAWEKWHELPAQPVLNLPEPPEEDSAEDHQAEVAELVKAHEIAMTKWQKKFDAAVQVGTPDEPLLRQCFAAFGNDPAMFAAPSE